MLMQFKRWVENIELDTEDKEIEARLDYEERFGTLRIIVRRRETLIKRGKEEE